MTEKQKVTTMAVSDYVFGNFGGKVGQMSIPDFRSHLYDDSPEGESPELSALKSRISAVEDKNTEQDGKISSLEAKDATHDTKIAKIEERVLQYIYPKIYQLNEGAGASKFDGFYEGSASVSPDRKEAATEGYTYKVVFKSGSFYLQEIDQDGETVFLYSSWNKIDISTDKHIASSEIYALRDCLYYIFVDGEGSTYYYIDSNGTASEKSATYLLRKLVDKNASEIATARTAAQGAKSAAETAQATATTAQEKNTAQDARLDNIEARIEPDIAGRVWNEDNGTPKAESYYGSVKALRDLPKRLGLGRYIVKDDRTRRKLDPNDSTKYLDDGSTAKLDGTDGQCMWCWEGFYANIWHEGSRLIKAVTFDGPVGNDISIWIPAGGISWLGAGVIDRGDAPYTDKTKWKLCSIISDPTLDPALYGPEFKAERYRGGSGSELKPENYSKAPSAESPQITMLGMPATYISTTDFGNYARKRGEGWEANWFVARFVVEFLFEVIMGTENSQEAFNNLKDANGLYQGGFGNGVTDMTDWGNYNGSYPVIPTSVGLEAGDGVCLVEYNLPNASGGTYHTFNVPVFFGLVGAGFGMGNRLVRGLIIDVGAEKSLVYVTKSMYDTYYPDRVDDENKILVAECPRVGGFITRKSYRGLCCMPTEVGGSQNIRYSDSIFTQISKGLRVRGVGGSPDGENQAGISNTYIHNTAAFYSTGSTSPLCYFTEDPKIPLSQSIANN